MQVDGRGSWGTSHLARSFVPPQLWQACLWAKLGYPQYVAFPIPKALVGVALPSQPEVLPAGLGPVTLVLRIHGAAG